MRMFLCLALAFCCVIQPEFQNSQKETPGVFYVTGTGWHTCSDWKDENSSFKVGYIIGYFEGVNQLAQISTDPNVKKSFDMGSGLKYGDYVKSVDSFCGDYRNLGIPLPNAVGIVVAGLTGKMTIDDKGLPVLRCLAAAGIDQSKINECYKRQ